jgi:hypothetical protein
MKPNSLVVPNANSMYRIFYPGTVAAIATGHEGSNKIKTCTFNICAYVFCFETSCGTVSSLASVVWSTMLREITR